MEVPRRFGQPPCSDVTTGTDMNRAAWRHSCDMCRNAEESRLCGNFAFRMPPWCTATFMSCLSSWDLVECSKIIDIIAPVWRAIAPIGACFANLVVVVRRTHTSIWRTGTGLQYVLVLRHGVASHAGCDRCLCNHHQDLRRIASPAPWRGPVRPIHLHKHAAPGQHDTPRDECVSVELQQQWHRLLSSRVRLWLGLRTRFLWPLQRNVFFERTQTSVFCPFVSP